MNRRDVLASTSVLGLGMAGMFDPQHGRGSGHSGDGHAQVMTECHAICNAVVAQCMTELSKGNRVEAHAEILRHTIDCQRFCSLALTMMLHESPMTDIAHQACAEACLRCGDICEKLGQSEVVAQCVEICRRCEEGCAKLGNASEQGNSQ